MLCREQYDRWRRIHHPHNQGYGAALQQLGVRSLRYPEGEMADEYLWSTAPFTAPQPIPNTGTGNETPRVVVAPAGPYAGSVYVAWPRVQSTKLANSRYRPM